MGKLNRLRKIKRDFVTLELYGVDGILAFEQNEEGKPYELIPLSVKCSPPSPDFAIRSKTITSFLGRHLPDMKKIVEKSKGMSDTKRKHYAEELQAKLEKNALEKTEEQDIFAMMTTLGKEYLAASAVECWYDTDDRQPCVFTADKKIIAELNKSGEGYGIDLSLLSLDDMTAAGSLLLGSSSKSVNVPLTNGEGGESSVQDDDLANFPLEVW